MILNPRASYFVEKLQQENPHIPTQSSEFVFCFYDSAHQLQANCCAGSADRWDRRTESWTLRRASISALCAVQQFHSSWSPEFRQLTAVKATGPPAFPGQGTVSFLDQACIKVEAGISGINIDA